MTAIVYCLVLVFLVLKPDADTYQCLLLLLCLVGSTLFDIRIVTFFKRMERKGIESCPYAGYCEETKQ